MLKRRASSPPPSASSNIPLVSDSTVSENMREIKRRRVQPPVLDGQMRGWGTPQDILYEDFDEEDDGEEDVIEDEQPLTSDSAVLAVNSPYRSANGFLHELHTLQRHRLLFTSSTSNPQLSFSPLPAHDSSSHQSHALSHQPDKGLVRTGANTRRECFEDSLSALNARKQQEYDLVKGNYEEMNRLLGSVVLSRRRELEPNVERNDT